VRVGPVRWMRIVQRRDPPNLVAVVKKVSKEMASNVQKLILVSGGHVRNMLVALTRGQLPSLVNVMMDMKEME